MTSFVIVSPTEALIRSTNTERPGVYARDRTRNGFDEEESQR